MLRVFRPGAGEDTRSSKNPQVLRHFKSRLRIKPPVRNFFSISFGILQILKIITRSPRHGASPRIEWFKNHEIKKFIRSPRYGGADYQYVHNNRKWIRRGVRVVHKNHEDKKHSSESFDCAPWGQPEAVEKIFL